MNIQIGAVIIHEIAKKEGQTGANLTLTDKVLDGENLQIKEIVSQLDKSFSKKTLRMARFSDDGFKSEISDFEKIDLVKSSKSLSRRLRDGIQNALHAKGGYIVFCQYKTIRNYFSVFLVRNTKGSFLERKAMSREWDIKSVQHLDVKHFAMGMRINLSLLKSNPTSRYIQLVRGQTDISEYFENWIGLEDRKRETEDGDIFYDEIIEKIKIPDGIEDREAFKREVFNYAKLKKKKINLQDFGRHFYNDEEEITRHCEDKGIDLDGEFNLNNDQLKKLFRISVSADGIKLDAPRSKFSQSGIRVSGSNVIIISKNLADEIRKELQTQE